MSGSFEKVKISAMKARLESVAKQNIGKIVYTIFLMTLLQSILCSAAIFPIARGSVRADGIESAVLFLLSFSVYLLFQFGLQTVLLRITRGEFVTLGFLFSGFRDISKSIFVVLPFSILFLAVTFCSKFVFSFFEQTLFSVQTSEENLTMISYGLPLLIFVLISFIFVILPFAFAFLYRIDGNSAAKSFALSAKTLFPLGMFKLVALAFLASWKQILVCVVAGAISIVLASRGQKIVAMLFDFVYIINSATALAKIELSAPIFYESLKKNAAGKILYLEV